MNRTLEWIVYSYLGLSVAHWWSVVHYLHASRGGGLQCGNGLSDPLLFLMNKVGPLAAVCVAVLLHRRNQGRRRPLLPTMVLPSFLGTTVTLVLEAEWLLRDHGVPLSRTVWWFPWL
jgi:hypothetical protein